ncbi:MAG: DUF421 domain-containing protein [Ruminococcaceae bacterium]|nr:DUF421 domain-containing protein [Oscillospiraceae bacterium]
MISTVIRCAVMYVFVTFAIRLMGKRQIGDLQPNELVVTILISEIAAIPLQDPTRPLLSGITAIFALIVLEIIISVIVMKSQAIRTLMSGKAVVIIKDGKVDEGAMKKVRITVLDLIELLRQNGIFDISEVAFAVLEVNGNLSVLRRSAYDSPIRSDLKIKAEESLLPLPVICDGKTIKSSMQELSLSFDELEKILKREKIHQKDVFILTVDRERNAQAVRKEE